MDATTAKNETSFAHFRQALTPTVWVAALGYFVDIYDLLLFRIVREPSLLALGVPPSQTLAVGVTLDNFQQAGLLLGGVLWGALGDRRGRVSVLYASILLYSLANVANAFVTDLTAYQWLRMLAGVGLAGELGVAITLVSEVLPPKVRGFGTTVIATVGVLGAVVAAGVAKLTDWKVAYLVGGGLGLALLLLRVRMAESGLFREAPSSLSVTKGNFFALFASRERALRYLLCIFMAVPIWYVIGLLVAYGDKIAPTVGVTEAVTSADTILWAYAGLALGDLLSGVLSQGLLSRKKSIFVFLMLTLAFMVFYFTGMQGRGAQAFLALCFLLGLGVGYWAMFMQTTAEQFGTNLRATATTSASNFVRAMGIPMGLWMKAMAPTLGLAQSVALIGGVVLTLAFGALFLMKETFGRSLDFQEEANA